jgi:hypothetical protein
MSRKTTNLTPLQARKQLLVVESELNRRQLEADWIDVKAALDHFATQITTLTSVAESAVKLGATVTNFFHGFQTAKKHQVEEEEESKPSWISGLFNLAKRGVSLWQEL